MEETFERGTIAYMAPEMFGGSQRSESNERVYTESVDVYSFGILLWELMPRSRYISPNSPATQQDLSTFMKGVQGGARPSHEDLLCEQCEICADWKRLIGECWVGRPESRPKLTRVMGELKRLLSQLKKNEREHDSKGNGLA